MNYNTATLRNGLRIIHKHSPSPVVYCGYGINAGTRDELPDEEGMAHFCEHVTFKGTRKLTAVEIINSLESVGGDINAFTNKEDTVYHAAILKSHIAKAVNLLTDIVFHSTYPQAELTREVEVICDEIDSYNDSPAELIYDEFENMIFEGHPLGHNILGNAQRLKTFDSNSAREFTRRNYTADNAVFFAYGDIDFKKLVRTIEKATSDLPDSTPRQRKMPTELPEYKAREKVTEKNTHQAHVMIGCRAYDVNNRKRMPLYLLNNIMGGPGMNSRLNIRLRERNGLVYSVDSSMTSYSDTGLWCVYFGCNPDDIGKCRKLVRKELDRMMTRTIAPAQLEKAKKQIMGQIAIACDNREGFALDFAKSFLHYGWEKDIDKLFDDINSITAQEIQEVATELFAKENLTTLIYT